MQRKAIAALMISLLLLSACGHGAGEQTFEAFRDTLTGKLVTVTAQVRVQRGDTVTDYTLTCQELPDGYDTVVGEGGGTLSGGEKQRISIARAILKNAPIVILDEATASIDPENEHLIQQAISELTRDKTIITIAHRLATIQNADQILVVADGRIAEHGTHAELVQQDGLYRRFTAIREQAEGWRIAAE